MNKFLPVILLLAGVGVLVGAYFFIFKGSKEAGELVEIAPEVTLPDRPVASLTPTEDGHWLKLKIEKITLSAASLDYELLYSLPDGRTQGVPGTISLSGQSKIERDLLLGSESSGKFRYDEGVEQGTLTLRFRNERGKLAAKFSTGFHLQSDAKELSSTDGNFTLSLNKAPKKTFFVTMQTFGVYEMPPSEVTQGPYGVFSSSTAAFPGTVDLSGISLYRWTGSSWEKLESGKTVDLGIFIGTQE